jgi:hypothetical protein
MAREIELLTEAASKDRAVVEKDSNVLWSPQDLAAARASGRYAAEDELRPPGPGPIAVSGLFPGCLQQGGSTTGYSRFVVIAQTRYFLILADPGGDNP